jgi:hypothetical protein
MQKTLEGTPHCHTIRFVGFRAEALLNAGMNSRFPKGYQPSRVSFVTSSEKLIYRESATPFIERH